MPEPQYDFQSVRPYNIPMSNEFTDRALASIATLLKEATNLLPLLRKKFRGETRVNYSDGTYTYFQMTKPIFVHLDYETQKPIKQAVKFKDPYTNQIINKMVYIPNDEAIEELLSILEFMGLNQITQITNIDENTILDDLMEFECKLAALFCCKQKEWGIDKELMPMYISKIKTIVQDARYQCCEGSTLKAIQKTVQRIEQVQEGNTKQRFGERLYAR